MSRRIVVLVSGGGTNLQALIAMAEGELVGNFTQGRVDGVVSLDGGLTPQTLDQCRQHI